MASSNSVQHFIYVNYSKLLTYVTLSSGITLICLSMSVGGICRLNGFSLYYTPPAAHTVGHCLHGSVAQQNIIVGWKPTLIEFTFLDSFQNKSGKPQPIRTKVGTHAQVEGRQRSQNFGHDRLSGGKMGGSKVSPTPSFFVSNTRWLFGNFAMADFRQIWPWDMNRGWNADFGKKFRKSFHSGVICPQNLKLGAGQTGTSLGAGYRSRDALQRDTVYSTL